ncbi:hypothetical protein ASE12_11905 [Aeromicrobium sp. Root236]|uniref:hypothetical protein n=1 Tax=Aeromicrobium sp. Root236 TaxID=1736498 RepID=UPI0007007619|nr:hypothetical protein [Aeromicrobium sp. Root236]KRC65395.1 hypothetical protein ASE12_11905 [Aeromicrobium sp. Root236]
MAQRPTYTIDGVAHYSCADAAVILCTSAVTVRELGVRSELEGRRAPRGKRQCWYFTVTSVETFKKRHGIFPTAKARARDTLERSSHPTKVDAHSSRHRELQLEAVIRAQTIAITQLTLAAAAEARAAKHLEAALSERRQSAEHLRSAVQEFAETTGQEGIPSNVADLI